MLTFPLFITAFIQPGYRLFQLSGVVWSLRDAVGRPVYVGFKRPDIALGSHDVWSNLDFKKNTFGRLCDRALQRSKSNLELQVINFSYLVRILQTTPHNRRPGWIRAPSSPHNSGINHSFIGFRAMPGIEYKRSGWCVSVCLLTK